LIYDEIIAKAHELHLNRLFQECRTPGGYKNVNRWYEARKSRNSHDNVIVFAVEVHTDYYNAARRFGISCSKKKCLSYNTFFNIDYSLKDIRVIN
jgi:hypothetical protein